MTFSISEMIKKRRAVFPQQFNNHPISKVHIHRVLEAANWAPTHKKTEPWRFKVFQNNSKLELGAFLAKAYTQSTTKPSEFKAKKISSKSQQSHTVIVICMQRDPKERIPEWEEVAATAMAVQNMWLTCTELGIGAYWSSPSFVAQLNTFLKLEEGEQCLGLFYMGHYDAPLEQGDREPIEHKVQWLID